MDTDQRLAEQRMQLTLGIRAIGAQLRKVKANFTLGDLADAIDAELHKTVLMLPDEECAARLQGWEGHLNLAACVIRNLGTRNGVRKTLPPRPEEDYSQFAKEVAFATRAAWRHLQFALGKNVNLGGLMSAQFECKGNGNAIAQAIIDALVPPAASVGLLVWQRISLGRREWHGDMYGR